MKCPECSSTIDDPQAVFCPRCGTKLSRTITSPTVGWEPVPTDQFTINPPPHVQSNSGNTKLRALKVVISGILVAIMLTWCQWVTNYLEALPDKSEAVYHAMQNPHNMETFNGFGNDLSRDSFNAALPVGIIFGLVIGVGVGLILTLPETAKNARIADGNARKSNT